MPYSSVCFKLLDDIKREVEAMTRYMKIEYGIIWCGSVWDVCVWNNEFSSTGFDHKPVKVGLLTDHDWSSGNLHGSEYDELVSLHHSFSCELMRYISQEMDMRRHNLAYQSTSSAYNSYSSKFSSYWCDINNASCRRNNYYKFYGVPTTGGQKNANLPFPDQHVKTQTFIHADIHFTYQFLEQLYYIKNGLLHSRMEEKLVFKPIVIDVKKSTKQKHMFTSNYNTGGVIVMDMFTQESCDPSWFDDYLWETIQSYLMQCFRKNKKQKDKARTGKAPNLNFGCQASGSDAKGAYMHKCDTRIENQGSIRVPCRYKEIRKDKKLQTDQKIHHVIHDIGTFLNESVYPNIFGQQKYDEYLKRSVQVWRCCFVANEETVSPPFEYVDDMHSTVCLGSSRITAPHKDKYNATLGQGSPPDAHVSMRDHEDVGLLVHIHMRNGIQPILVVQRKGTLTLSHLADCIHACVHVETYNKFIQTRKFKEVPKPTWLDCKTENDERIMLEWVLQWQFFSFHNRNQMFQLADEIESYHTVQHVGGRKPTYKKYGLDEKNKDLRKKRIKFNSNEKVIFEKMKFK